MLELLVSDFIPDFTDAKALSMLVSSFANPLLKDFPRFMIDEGDLRRPVDDELLKLGAKDVALDVVEVRLTEDDPELTLLLLDTAISASSMPHSLN